MRSIRKDTPYIPKPHDNIEHQLNMLKAQMECEEIGILIEPRAWMSVTAYKKYERTISSNLFSQTKKA